MTLQSPEFRHNSYFNFLILLHTVLFSYYFSQGGEKSSGGITAAELLALRNKKVAKPTATNTNSSGGSGA